MHIVTVGFCATIAFKIGDLSYLELKWCQQLERLIIDVLFCNKQDIGFPLRDLQSKWVARVLSGKVLLPNEEEMAASTEEHYRQMEENGVPKRFTHALYPNGVLHLLAVIIL